MSGTSVGKRNSKADPGDGGQAPVAPRVTGRFP